VPGLRSRASRQTFAFSTIRQAAPAIRIIRRFLRNRKLSPKEVELLNRANGCALHSLHLVDRDDPIAEMVAKKIIEVGATVRDPEEVCKLAVEQLGRPNQTGLTFRFLCLALADPSPIRLAAVRRCGPVDAGQQVGLFRVQQRSRQTRSQSLVGLTPATNRSLKSDGDQVVALSTPPAFALSKVH